MSNPTKNIAAANNHYIVADSSSANVNLVASRPGYVAGRYETHKPCRAIIVGGAGTLVVRYAGAAADSAALTFGGATGIALGIPIPMELTNFTASGSTATAITVLY